MDPMGKGEIIPFVTSRDPFSIFLLMNLMNSHLFVGPGCAAAAEQCNSYGATGNVGGHESGGGKKKRKPGWDGKDGFPYASQIIQIPGEKVFRTHQNLLRRCLGIQNNLLKRCLDVQSFLQASRVSWALFSLRQVIIVFPLHRRGDTGGQGLPKEMLPWNVLGRWLPSFLD